MQRWQILCGAVLVSCGAGLSACSSDLDDNWQIEVHSMPWLASPLSQHAPVAEAAQTAATGEQLDYYGLHIPVPGNMSGSKRIITVSDSTEHGTMQKEVLRFEEKSGKRRAFTFEFVPGFITRDVGLGETPEVKRWCPDFEKFRRTFATDYDLIRAAYAAVPDDVDKAKSESKRQELRTLLMVKDSLDLPAEEIRLPKLDVFEHKLKRSGIIFVSTFDETGKFKARFAFYQLNTGAETRPAAPQSGDEEEMLVNLLQVSHFGD